MERMEQPVRWYTTKQYVDIDTGELITKSLFERDYIKIKQTKIINYEGKTRRKTITVEARKNPQLKLI